MNCRKRGLLSQQAMQASGPTPIASANDCPARQPTNLVGCQPASQPASRSFTAQFDSQPLPQSSYTRHSGWSGLPLQKSMSGSEEKMKEVAEVQAAPASRVTGAYCAFSTHTNSL